VYEKGGNGNGPRLGSAPRSLEWPRAARERAALPRPGSKAPPAPPAILLLSHLSARSVHLERLLHLGLQEEAQLGNKERDGQR